MNKIASGACFFFQISGVLLIAGAVTKYDRLTTTKLCILIISGIIALVVGYWVRRKYKVP